MTYYLSLFWKNTDLYNLAGRPNIFSTAELKLATENFSSQNMVGEGGYGPVYKVRGFTDLLHKISYEDLHYCELIPAVFPT